MVEPPPEIATLRTLIVSLEAEVQLLRAENADLKARLAQNSTNSHQPPASDGPAKKVLIKPALPKIEGRKKGGQPGHPGRTLSMVETPDAIIQHGPSQCPQCQAALTGPTQLVARRQVFDLPPPRLWVEEHQLLAQTCACGCRTVGQWPQAVAAPVQYGPRLSALSAVWNVDYRLPFAKVQQLWADLTGYGYNPATLSRAQQRLDAAIAPLEAQVRQQLLAAPVCHFDETSLRVEGRLQWLHVACNEAYTLLSVSPGRGQAQLSDSVFLACRNWTVHDCYASYLAYGQGQTALCGAHLVRELQALVEQGRAWAKGLQTLLLDLYEATRAGPLPWAEGWYWRQQYAHWCGVGDGQELGPLVFWGADGRRLPQRAKRTKARSLLDRLMAYQEAILAFAFEVGVPFTNNEAERALRPAKIKQKVSGGFRTQAGARTYARLAGFMATLRKQDRDLLDELTNVLTGHFQWAT
jgi:transposase